MKDIPKFWPVALMNSTLATFIQADDDIKALSALEDVWVQRDPTESRVFTIEFVSVQQKKKSVSLYNLRLGSCPGCSLKHFMFIHYSTFPRLYFLSEYGNALELCSFMCVSEELFTNRGYVNSFYSTSKRTHTLVTGC